MNKFFLSLILIIGGIFLGWYSLISWQRYTLLVGLNKAAQTDSAELAKIEQFLTTKFGGK